MILGGKTVTKCFQSDKQQIVKGQMVLEVFHNFPGPLNIYSDSLYVVNTVRYLEASTIISTTSPVSCVFLALCQKIKNKKYPFYITHIRAHSLLPGPLTDANAQADAITKAFPSLIMDPLAATKQFHQLYHVSTKVLRLKFDIIRQNAKK